VKLKRKDEKLGMKKFQTQNKLQFLLLAVTSSPGGSQL